MQLGVADVLHDCRLFARVPPEGFQRLVVIARLCKFRKEEPIFRQGDPCPGVYVVGNGLVRVFKAAATGKEHVLHMVGPGGTFAEAAAIGRFPCPANAETIAPTVCALLPTDLLHKALEADHQLCLGMLTGMTLWVRHLVGLMEDIVLRDAAGRLAGYLLSAKRSEGDQIELPGLKRHVASHLNLTSETFSRTLRRLVEAQLIDEPDANHIRLADPKKLRLVAEGRFPKL